MRCTSEEATAQSSAFELKGWFVSEALRQGSRHPVCGTCKATAALLKLPLWHRHHQLAFSPSKCRMALSAIS